MTQQADVMSDKNYISVLDHGFVGMVDHMGSDNAIVQAARVSYGSGTKSVREDRGLIRYLLRMEHTSPFELCVVKLHIKAPIFVLRQLFRHRTHSANEYSGRYSLMTDEFYLPEPDVIQPQSADNKQGRTGMLSETSQNGVRWMMDACYQQSYDCYQTLLGERNPSKFSGQEVLWDAYSDSDPLLDQEFPGIARELARCVLPVANYSELYWQQNLLNLFKLLKLRTDGHAQYEIRQFSQAILSLITPLFPIACEAFADYQHHACKLSRMESALAKELMADMQTKFQTMIANTGGTKQFAEQQGMNVRELNEFAAKFGLSLAN